MIIQVPLTALAESPGDTTGSSRPIMTPGGKGYGKNGTAPIFDDYGFRVTISDGNLDGVIEGLKGGYTDRDLDDQRQKVVEHLRHIYMEPGNDGIYFYGARRDDFRPNWGVMSSYGGKGFPIQNHRIKIKKNTTVTDQDNKLAAMCYSGIDGFNRTVSTAYVPDMGKALFGAAGNYETGGDFLYHMKTMFMANANLNSEQEFKSYIVELMRDLMSNGNGTGNNIRNFSWDTSLYTQAGVTAQDRAKWSQIGYVTMLIQFAWLAQVTDNPSYQQFETAIWNWVGHGYLLRDMPLLEVEACQEIGLDGTNTPNESNSQLATLPYTIRTQYPDGGSGAVETLYRGWDSNKTIQDVLVDSLGTSSPVKDAVVGQGLGYTIKKGAASDCYKDRAYCRLAWPSDDKNASYGYLLGFTYVADTQLTTGGVINPTNPNVEVPGSFTWKLTPNGAHDMTPDTEVNESSTVYEINVSQNGYNQNNIDKWKTYIAQNGNNNNRMRITVYRVPEDLADTKASQYTREQVMQQGKNATEGFDRVVVGDAKITGLPNATSGTESGTMTNEELINILNTGTGLAMTSETIRGSLEQGIRVTYAVRVEVKVGNKAWQDFTNNQAEWVEYRSTPGTYEYKSDAPDGYAEIKCGYFNTDAYREPYEAMAGLPTTENLYFVSGGQEFVAQLKYEYTPNMTAVRNFEQKYQGTQCEGYWEPVTMEFKNATVEEINQWLRDHTDAPSTTGDFITAKKCSVCGTTHTNGTGNEHIIKTEITKWVSGDDKPVPGNYYTELDLEAVTWDWENDGGEGGGHEEGTDENGEPIEVSCEFPHEYHEDLSEEDKPDPVECDYGGCYQEFHKVRARRYSGTVKSYHVHYENGDGHQTNLGAIRWTQSYTGMNYAKIKEAHVWRLEQSKVNGIRQITFEDDDTVTGTGKELADVIFNVAESDTAKEGRMWYSIHPEDNDNYVGKLQLATRGCCHCFNHNAAEDLIASKDDPNQIFENAWCVSEIVGDKM
ncbi:hypothetical protein [Brotaphodocola sp.]|uniref:hypothetical protein n=1 Tax=Brotaphodocola sp. TaxID=3073577 RepID=UPI003D7E3FE1